MATRPDADPQPGTEDTLEPKPGETVTEQETETDDEPPPPDPVATLAQEMGWVPKEQFRGPEEEWKPADQFIRDGREIQRGLAHDLKAVRGDLDNIRRTSASIVEQQVAERVQALGRQYTQAVEDGDIAGSFRISQEITKAQQPLMAPTVPQGPDPSAQDFAQRHSTWFNKDPLATSLAIDTTNKLAAQGYDVPTQLREAERAVKRQFPEHFGQPNGYKPPAGVNAPGGRETGPPANRKKGFADMPRAAQDVAKDMTNRGVIKSTDDYVRNYWANEGSKA